MVARKKTTRRSKKRPAKKQGFLPGIRRLLLFLLLFFVLIFSLCTAGYVIFFRTVLAQEIMPGLKNNIVFEEPVPPVLQEIPKIVNPSAAVPPVVKIAIKEEATLPKVALIIDDIGYQYETGKQLLELPLELTFSFLPFAPYTKKLEEIAYGTGKTVMLHLPLEPQSAAFDPGPGALKLADSPEIQREKFQLCLAEVPHAVGVNNHMGSLYTQDKIAMDRLMVELSNRSLIFVDSYTTAATVGLECARAHGVKSVGRDVFLDNLLSKDHICGQLGKLAKIAIKGGVAVGIAHPHAATLEALKSCASTYKSKVQYVSILDIL